MNTNVKQKWNRWIAVAVALLMLATLVMPMNVATASANSKLKNPTLTSNIDGIATWDCIYFGHYPQSVYQPKKIPQNLNENEIYTDTDGTKFVYVSEPQLDFKDKHYYKIEPIKWRVLSTDGNKALLLTDRPIEGNIPFNTQKIDFMENLTWEICTLRSWLNGYDGSYNSNNEDYSKSNFLNKAFTKEEQNALVETLVINDENTEIEPEFVENAGNNTNDKVFVLSMQEVKNPDYGFSEDIGIPDDVDVDKTRQALNTDYAECYMSAYKDIFKETWWILRTKGDTTSCITQVLPSGVIDIYGPSGYESKYFHHNYTIRPALYLDLSKDVWSYAGTVSSENNATDENPIIPEKPANKLAQSITAKSFTKTYGNKAFNLGAKAKTKLSYKSSNTSVAMVNSSGKVTLKGPGKATITITAAATGNYNAATKKITVTVKPKKVIGIKAKQGKKRMTVSWKRDSKSTGYQITYAQNKKFKKGKKNITISKNKTVKRTIKKLKARKTYYIKVRAYKKVGKTKIYGAYSTTKRVKVK